MLRELGGRHFTIALLPTKKVSRSSRAVRASTESRSTRQSSSGEEASAAGVDSRLNRWGPAFDEADGAP